MVNKELFFFLTPIDLIEVIKDFESYNKVSYYKAEMSSSAVISKISSLLEERFLGQLIIGDWNHSPSYLIADSEAKILPREIKLRKGGSSFSIDQLGNSDTIIFKPSGIFVDGILIAGSLTTISTTNYSINIFKSFVKVIKQYTNKIGSFYVGPEAREKLSLGWRLVTIASSPTEYDLVLD